MYWAHCLLKACSSHASIMIVPVDHLHCLYAIAAAQSALTSSR